jgi:hypothetical protein
MENDLLLPSETEILGMTVIVEEIDITDEDHLVAVCRRDNTKQRISLSELPLPSPIPEGAEWIVAYRYWRTWQHSMTRTRKCMPTCSDRWVSKAAQGCAGVDRRHGRTASSRCPLTRMSPDCGAAAGRRRKELPEVPGTQAYKTILGFRQDRRSLLNGLGSPLGAPILRGPNPRSHRNGQFSNWRTAES